MKNYNKHLNGCYYLNNSGSRWVVFNNGIKQRIKVLSDEYSPCNEAIERTAVYFDAFGNFAAAVYYYKGKKYSSLNYELITQEVNQ
jgi:hypothetical protein